MAIQYFTLDDGVLELHEEKLVIFDKAKRKKLSDRLNSIFGILYSVSCIGIGLKKNDNDWLYFGIILLFIWIILIFAFQKKRIFENVDNEIKIKDISEVTFKRNKTGLTSVGDIKTKQNKIRQILISNDELQDLQLQEEFKKLNIETSL
jgi:hypothetical protein